MVINRRYACPSIISLDPDRNVSIDKVEFKDQKFDIRFRFQVDDKFLITGNENVKIERKNYPELTLTRGNFYKLEVHRAHHKNKKPEVRYFEVDDLEKILKENTVEESHAQAAKTVRSFCRATAERKKILAEKYTRKCMEHLKNRFVASEIRSQLPMRVKRPDGTQFQVQGLRYQRNPEEWAHQTPSEALCPSMLSEFDALNRDCQNDKFGNLPRIPDPYTEQTRQRKDPTNVTHPEFA